MQARRALPTRVVQAYQVRVLRGLYPSGARAARLPLVFRLVRRFRALRHLAGGFVGVGLRPEHVLAPDRPAP